ncbi:MAG: cbb3-type cytochrome oxidase assembly protein CcoS [Planctomycetota bacterium]
MTVLWIVIPMALLLASIGVCAFIWSVRNGQLDDLETPGVRLLIDDDDVSGPAEGGQEDVSVEKS